MTDRKFADGVWVTLPSRNAPEYILMNLAFKVEEFVKFLETNKNEKGYVNITVKEGKSGKPYSELNTFEPKGSTDKSVPMAKEIEEEEPDDLPF